MPPQAEIVFNNTRARIRAPRLILDEVDRMLAYYVPGYRFMLKFKRGLWDGRIHLFHYRDQGFPAGCVDRVARHLDEHYDVTIIDRRNPPFVHAKLAQGETTLELRDSQQQAVAAGLKETRGVFEAATGWGKTCLMAELVAQIGVPALVLVHRRELASQTLDRFRETIRFPAARNPFGIIGDGIWDPGLVTLATFQTIYSNLQGDPAGTKEWLRQFKALHCDEAHHVPAKTLYAVCNAVSEGYWRFGYSATPFKSDRASELRLVSVAGEIIYSFGARDAIEEGILVEPDIYMVAPGFTELEGHDFRGRYMYGWAKEYKDGIVTHSRRNNLIAEVCDEAASHGLPTLVLVQHLEQGRQIERRCQYQAVFVHGSHPTSVRKTALRRLTEGKLPILVASSIFDEGIDLPAIGCLVVAGGYKAHHKAIQRVGRGLRAAPGKERVLVFDFYDTHSERLLKHSRSRMAAYKKAGFEPCKVSDELLRDCLQQDSFWDERHD